MDAKTLAKIVQIVVQEEVSKIVKKELATMRKQIVAEIKQSIPTQQPLQEMSLQDVQVPDLGFDIPDVLPRRQQTPTKKLSNNSMINNILNETAGFGGEDVYEDYPTMGNAPMTSNNAMGGNVSNFRAMMAEKMGMTGMSQPGQLSVQEMIPSTNPEGLPTRTQQVPDHLAKALTRDYSQLVKAMNKK